jgi:hypothetical protein
VAEFRHDDSEPLFKPLGHQSPMAAHVERLPAEKDGIGAKLLSNLSCVQRSELLVVFPVKQFWVFCFEEPSGGARAMYRRPL